MQNLLTGADYKRDRTVLIRGYLFVVQRDRLADELIRDVLAVFVVDLTEGDRALQEYAEGQLGRKFGFD